MCGIAGFFGNGSIDIDAMLRALRHRGPDDSGQFAIPGAVLGMTRLAIIDPSPAGRQPMLTLDGQVAIIFNGGNDQTLLEMNETRGAARTLDLDVAPVEIRRMQDIAPAFEGLKPQADALYVVVDQLVVANLMRILTFALSTRLPMIFSTRDFVRSGGLMSYGPNYADLFRRAADYVNRILLGAKPGEIPVEQPTRFELVLNLTTARALGLRVPESFLLRVDDIIE